MILEKIILQNNKQINSFILKDKDAEVELLNLLFDKIKQRYKIKIYTDHINNNIKASLKFDHITADEKIIKYTYLYFFDEVNNKNEEKINLY